MEEEVPLPYPKGALIIVAFYFFERYCSYGWQAILVIYLTEKLSYNDKDAKVFYHTYAIIANLFPIVGGIMADSWIGKFKVIFFLSIVYCAGIVLLAVTVVDPLGLPQVQFSVLSIAIIAVGSGCSKPSVFAFGGDQYVLPQQQNLLGSFFELIYFSVNLGSLLATFSTPILRTQHCFGSRSCYALGFGMPAVMNFMSVVVFISGTPFYRHSNNDKKLPNILVRVVQCVFYAIGHRNGPNPGNHWLDRSTEKFGVELVTDVKTLFNVLTMFLPFPVFFALYDQQGSGWTLQAVRMNGDCGLFTILPDQMILANPLLCLVLIPTFSYIVYPALAKCHIMKKPLQRICCGGFLTAASFVVSGFLSLALERTDPVLPIKGEAQIRFYDPTDCQYRYSTVGDIIPSSEIKDGYHLDISVKVPNGQGYALNFNFISNNNEAHCQPRNLELIVEEQEAYGIYINYDDEGSFVDNVKKSDDGFPVVRTIASNTSIPVTYVYIETGKPMTIPAGDMNLTSVMNIGEHLVEGTEQKVHFQLGGTYTILINQELQTVKTIVVTNPNTIHILWLLPQYVVLTVAEIMWSITADEFSYSEAPVSMKTVVQAVWMLTMSMGNSFVVFIEKIVDFELQSSNFFAYSALMVVTMIIYSFMAMNYKRVNVDENPAQ